MLDWRDVVTYIGRAETLPVEDLMAELAELRKKSPDLSAEVTRYFSRKHRFMQTSAGGQAVARDILKPGTTLGVWRIIDHIGSGGMGDVYRAERNDGLYEQSVALKVIQTDDADNLQRFDDERKRLASLDHPGISRIIDGGATQDGRPYMVMEFVDGEPMDQFLSQQEVKLETRLNLFIKLCTAVAHAHSRLILHRDIKPANVLVDNRGAVRLIDFGIASLLDDEADVIGGPLTIAYAAPEQLTRSGLSIGSDIFALGVLLHTLLTGKAPERQSDGAVAIDNAGIKDADLAAILSKATAFKSDDRYLTAAAFADDLQAYLDLRPVEARAGGRDYRLGKYIRRNAAASGLAAAFVLALTGGLVVSLFMANKASKEAIRATAEAARANNELERAEWKVGLADMRTQWSNAYGDALKRIYGDTEDEDKLTEFLLKHHAETTKNYEQSPENAAINSFVISRHFLSRNDYVNVQKVTEPWIQKGYGSPIMLSYGRTNLGYAYRNMSENEKALEMFQEAAAFFPGTFEEGTMDHVSNLIEIFNFTKKPEDFNAASAVVNNLLATDNSPYTHMYLNYKLGNMAMQMHDWNAAYAYSVKSAAVFDEGAIAELAGQDTVRIGVALIEIFWNGDLGNAEKQIALAMEITEKSKGESRSLGSQLQYRAILRNERGRYDEAEADGKEALRLVEKYSKKSKAYFAILAQSAINYADKGDFVAAREILETLGSYGEKPGDWTALARLYIDLKDNGIEAAQQELDLAELNVQEAWRALPMNFYMRRMEKLGLTFPEPEGDIQFRPTVK